MCSTAENKSRSVYRVECSDSFMNPINIRKTGTDLSLLPRCPHPQQRMSGGLSWISISCITLVIDQTVATDLNSSVMGGIRRTYFIVHL